MRRSVPMIVTKHCYHAWTHAVRVGEASNPGPTGRSRKRSPKKESVCFAITNKNSFRSLADILANSVADIHMGQELRCVGEEFWRIKRWLLSGHYLYNGEEDIDSGEAPEPSQKWRAEGTASVTTQAGGKSAGNITCVKPNIDIAPPVCCAYNQVNARNKFESTRAPVCNGD